MSEYIKNNSKTVHIATEIVFFLALVIYVKKHINAIYTNLEQFNNRLIDYEIIHKKHESLFNELFSRIGYSLHHSPPQPVRTPPVESDPVEEPRESEETNEDDDYLDSIVEEEISRFS